ncbi:MAG: prephenate dehydrogenase/arogenate dehydrogenase family protein [bacterium]|nr:prephenate dehydrogenase/arogenate dehydrogenase family protein [bacterium]
MTRISIVGYGRFGKVLYRLLKNDFAITLYDKKNVQKNAELAKNTVVAKNVREVYTNDTVFYAVPIESFEKVISEHKKYFEKRHLLIDTLSVKIHPAQVFKKYLSAGGGSASGGKGTGAQAILTHPMFGPDSTMSGFAELPIIMDKFSASRVNYDFWKKFFQKKHLKVVEMSAREHDSLAADSQGLTHFVGRLLDLYGFEPTKIDSLGAKKLLEVKELINHDTWQLFTNLQHYNSFTKKMRIKLGEVYDTLYNKLLPKQANPDYITYGIQGGIGSFNEEAIMHYIETKGPHEHRIKYLYTSERVMRALHEGEIDRGQFAIQNSEGGLVAESIHAMAGYKFKIVDQFDIKISHALMIRPDAELNDIKTIMSHPQVFAQCKKTLTAKYPDLKLVSEGGDRIDHAVIAKELGGRKLSRSVAVMGSSVLAKLYGLKIVEDNLQDAKENYTSFLQVARIQKN